MSAVPLDARLWGLCRTAPPFVRLPRTVACEFPQWKLRQRSAERNAGTAALARIEGSGSVRRSSMRGRCHWA